MDIGVRSQLATFLIMRALGRHGLALIAACAGAAGAQVRVNPTGVSVNAMDATTVFLSFGGFAANARARRCGVGS